MPFNGAGVFVRVYNWVADAAAAIPITAARVDGEDDGYATGLSNCICKDGQTTIIADLPMSGFKLTGVGNASARNQNAVVGQIQDSVYNWVAGGGTSDVITATYAPAITALVDGMELDFRASAANTTTTPNFSPNGVTAHTITKNGGSALIAGDIPGAAFEGKLRYNLANTRWELMNPAITTQAPFLDTNALVKGSSDATKLIRFEVDGLTTATTRVYTAPDKNGTLAMTSDIPSAGVTAIRRQVITSTGGVTYTPDSHLLYADVELWGAGGGGGGVSAVAGAAAGGGGAGGYSKKIIPVATMGASQTVTLGTGGTAGANTGGTGGTGVTSTFGAILSATGGVGGIGSTSATTFSSGGIGGTGSGGDINPTGNSGQGSNSNNIAAACNGGQGGATSLGGSIASVVSAVGGNGIANSGAGGGGASAGSGTAHTGGVGGSGYCVITEYCSQ